LGYFKIINITHQSSKSQIDWIEQALKNIGKEAQISFKVISSRARAASRTVPEYLYGQCRCAVAHAYNESDSVNPDEISQVGDLSICLPIITRLARHLIESELNMPKKAWAA
jgi:hypothetical protein